MRRVGWIVAGPVISRDLCVNLRSQGLDVREYAFGPTRLPSSTSREMPRPQPCGIPNPKPSGRLIGAIVATVMLLGGGAQAAWADSPGFVPVERSAIVGVETSSAAPRTMAAALVDGSVTRGWLSERGDTLGATITVRFRGARWISRVGIAPGRHKPDGRSFVRPAKVSVRAGDVQVVGGLEDRGAVQWVTLPRPVAVEALTLVVEAVHGFSHVRVLIEELYFEGPEDILAAVPGLREELEEEMTSLGDDPDGPAGARLLALGRASVPALRGRAEGCDGARSVAALALLARIDEAEARRATSGLLSLGRPECAEVALRLLRERPLGGVTEGLLAAAGSAGGAVAKEALALLAGAGEARALPLLERALRDSEPAALPELVALLPRFDEEGLAVIERALTWPDPERRAPLILGVAGFGRVPAATTLLVTISKSERAEDAGWAIAALGRLKREDARAALRTMIAEDPARRALALEALATSGRLGDGLLEWIDWVDPEARERIVAALAKTQTEVSREILVALLLTPRAVGSRSSALNALVAHGAAGFEAVIERLVEDPTLVRYAYGYLEAAAPSVAAAASKKVRHLPPERRYDDLRMALLDMLRATHDGRWSTVVYAVYRSDELTPQVREYALDVLGELPSPEVARWLMSEIEGGDRDELTALRMKAVVAMGGAEVHERLFEKLEHSLPGDWTPAMVRLLADVDRSRVLEVCGGRFRFAHRRTQIELLAVAYQSGTRSGLDLLFEGALSRDGAIRRRAFAWLSLPLASDELGETRRDEASLDISALIE